MFIYVKTVSYKVVRYSLA